MMHFGVRWIYYIVCTLVIMQFVPYILVSFAVWLLALSAVLVWIYKYFRKLSKQVGKGNLVRVLERVLDNQKKNTKSIDAINSEIESIIEDGSLHVQKLGLVRFNPFDEMGGDHSFSLALLDGIDKGIIITGLHTRERTRVYIKEIKKGKSELQLSREERKALKLAQKN